VETFLSKRNLPFSYTKERLYAKLAEGLDNGNFSEFDLIDLLDEIEEFGNQHIYLFNCNEGYIKSLRDPIYVQNRLNEYDLKELYNNKYRTFIPNELALSSVIHDKKTLKFKWIEKRHWKSPIEEKIEEDKFIQVHQINTSRGVTTFRVDLVTGNAELMIQRLQSGTKYGDIKENYLLELSKFLDIHTFRQIKLRRAIRMIEESNEVEKRQINFETISGSKVAFKSRAKGTDYASDPNAMSARKALGQNVSGSLGNFYWNPNEWLTRAIHIHIYSDDDRIAIFNQCMEKEVTYVLSRIRYFASR